MNIKLLFIMLSIFLVCSCGGGQATKVDQSKLLEDQKALAMASIKRGNFQQGIKDIEAAEKIDPDDGEIYLIKGIIYFGLKDNSLAEQNYKKALSLDPKLTVANFNLCGFYIKVTKYDDAITYCEKALSDPVYDARAEAFTTLGIAYFKKGDYEKARENYDKALQVNPSLVYTHNEMGKLYMSLGRENEAIDEFLYAIQGYKYYDEAYFNLGLAYLKKGETFNACASFRKVIEVAPNSLLALNANSYLNTVCRDSNIRYYQ